MRILLREESTRKANHIPCEGFVILNKASTSFKGVLSSASKNPTGCGTHGPFICCNHETVLCLQAEVPPVLGALCFGYAATTLRGHKSGGKLKPNFATRRNYIVVSLSNFRRLKSMSYPDKLGRKIERIWNCCVERYSPKPKSRWIW